MTQLKAKPINNWLWALYLVNLLLLPGIAALAAVVLMMKEGNTRQTRRLLFAFVLCVLLLIAIPLIGWLSFAHNGMFWVFFICYWVTAHASVILLGVFGLIRSHE